MNDDDPYFSKIEQCFARAGLPVNVKKSRGGYSIFSARDNAPMARLRLTDTKDIVEVLWWSHRDKWESIGDFGGIFFSFDNALKYLIENAAGFGFFHFLP